jgi:hypothetical protein
VCIEPIARLYNAATVLIDLSGPISRRLLVRIFLIGLLGVFAIAELTTSAVAAPVAPPERPPAEEPLAAPPPAEFLAKIAAPAVRPIIKTKQGYSIEVDRTSQVLSVRTPKKDIWTSPEVEARQTVEVVTEGAPLQQETRGLARLKKGRRLYALEARGNWLQTQIVLDGNLVRGWVERKHLKPVAEDDPPQKSLAQQSDNYASAAMLIQKAKQFDDGLYAAVELALQDGLRSVVGKKDWLPKLAAQIEASQGGAPLGQLLAATKLGGGAPAVPNSLRSAVEAETKSFLADEKRSKPLGFYTWSPQLEAIFRQDRMLQSSVEVAKHRAGVLAMAKALAGTEELRERYEHVLHLNERLTNRLTGPGYRPLIAAIEAGQSPDLSSLDSISFLPASRSHESDLVMRLYGNRPIPPGFELMTEVIKRLKRGELSFEPTKESGWYDHQLWSLEPLVRYDTAPEAAKARANDEYRMHLEELFKGTYALMRETHVKQLELAAPAEAPPPPVKEREKVFIQPDPHVELLPTMYLRRAQSYRFVRQVLVEAFGQDNLGSLKRLTALGPVTMNLSEELDQMERLFSGAYVVACRELGLAEALPAELGAGHSADEQAKVFMRWTASLRSDPDLARDARMMVPVFYDQQRKKVKVWAMLGWEHAQCSIDYARHPGIKITDGDGKPVSGEEGPEVIFFGSYRSLATPVFAEVYINRLMNRDEFRRHCDAYQSKAAILANLE